MFEYDFMIRALIGVTMTGLIAPAIGIYLVQRRLSLIGDGLGHVALTGVGVGLLLNQQPVLMAVIVAALGAVAVELVRERGRTSGDVALAILFYGGISGGVVLVSMSSNASGSNLMSYLFGSPLTASKNDLYVTAGLAAAVLAVTLLLRPWLFAVCQDEEHARVSGVPVRLLNLTLAVAAAVTVTAAMRTVGLLLVSALMVIPVATAQQVSRGFTATMVGAMGLGVAASAGGLWTAWKIDSAPGATIVLVAIGGFVVVTLAVAARARLSRLMARTPTGPDPTDDPECVLHP
ncbi:metal ABC transporter permease [Virgisporangium aurantiacum]|uniref:ABC transporter n=1 Tax=Virgisporangium aurantiacum TaxID=175570 RepID=A0A8J3ZH94_9ACTN|nr:metal ABC transporter permease [Virgisporangium aurantiacum]GIJ61358.1 ABC transporter [Virgisporangium aurantiacum]